MGNLEDPVFKLAEIVEVHRLQKECMRYPAELGECVVYQVVTDVMQGLEHQDDVEARVCSGNVLGAAKLEPDIVRIFRCLVVRELYPVHLQRENRGGLPGNQAGLVRFPASEFEHRCVLQRQEFVEDGFLVGHAARLRGCNTHFALIHVGVWSGLWYPRDRNSNVANSGGFSDGEGRWHLTKNRRYSARTRTLPPAVHRG